MPAASHDQPHDQPPASPPDSVQSAFVPWYRQAGAWVVIGVIVVAAAAAVVVLNAKGGDPSATVVTGSPTPGVTATAEPDATSTADAPAVTPVPVSACPQASEIVLGEEGQPAGASADYGIQLGCDAVPGGPQSAATVRVNVISDYSCPICQTFAEMIWPQLEEALRAGQIQLAVHPLGYLDEFSSTDYSSRAARAVTAVAALDPVHFTAFDEALWLNQPPKGGVGLSDQEIAALAEAVGVDPAVIPRLAGGEFDSWVATATAAITSADQFQGTPWVLIGDGQSTYMWDWSSADVQTAIANVAAGQQP
ncbi:MAG: thioredoxin domain-containing protein [Bifidobacteriaceae bacterium]|jgi:protein-disulfide isomerase|nr:thioredoxin domain-containing protein [Bifidobacteriaceae bacterium]